MGGAFVSSLLIALEIQMVTELLQWQHVAKGENPADKCTRGATPHELMENSLWWHGEKWLLLKDKAIGLRWTLNLN